MKRQLRRLIRQFTVRVLPFCLGLLLVGVQIGPSLAKVPIPAKDAPTQPDATKPALPPVFTVPEAAPVPSPSAPQPAATVESSASDSESSQEKSDVVKTPDGETTAEDTETAKTDAALVKPKSPEELVKFNKFIEADRLYKAGQVKEAAAIYRELKPNFNGIDAPNPVVPPVTDIEQMSARAAHVYWRESTAGLEANLETRIFVPLKLLVKQHPEFIPGHVRLAQAYEDYDRPAEALAVLQAASTRYPDHVDLLNRRIQALGKAEQWMEASIAARQFTLLNPEHTQAKHFSKLADENLRLYRKDLKRQLTGNVIGNVITGALGYALTGSLIGPLNSLQTSFLLLRGESALGDSVARRAKNALDLVTDEETNKYVNEIGAKLAAVAGREDFKYEFVVVKDKALNAFALPGGKVFINAGAIAKTNSEAELAGLVGHEISHAVLAHGLQLFTRGSLTSNITQFIPYVGGLAENIITFSYSRDMERQADAVGTRLLASAGYASDGLWQLMHSLKREEAARKRPRPPEWLSTHPGGDERLENVQNLITQVGYNRYAYEGVERHDVIKQKMITLLAQEAAKKDGKKLEIIDKRNPKPTSESKPRESVPGESQPTVVPDASETPPAPGTQPEPVVKSVEPPPEQPKAPLP